VLQDYKTPHPAAPEISKFLPYKYEPKLLRQRQELLALVVAAHLLYSCSSTRTIPINTADLEKVIK